VLGFFFENVECKVLGLTKSISLYRFYACSHPRREECRRFAGQSNA
jgi:hypothetical protein